MLVILFDGPCRFGGTEFPPIVLFKVYTSMAPRREGQDLERKEGQEGDTGSRFQALSGKGGHIQYITGQKMITPHSKVKFTDSVVYEVVVGDTKY